MLVLDLDLFNDLFRDPESLFLRLREARVDAHSKGLPRPAQIVMSPTELGEWRLFGIRIVFDSTISVGEIELRGPEDQPYVVKKARKA